MSTINRNKPLTSMQAELRALEKSHGSTVELSKIKDPALRTLAGTVATGCSRTTVDLKALRASLKTIGSELRSVDKNNDGQLNATEQKKLSPLAARLLQAAGHEVARPSSSTVSTGCSTPAPRPHTTVSTGCSTPAPRPSTNTTVSTGCGTSTPVRPAPIRTGC